VDALLHRASDIYALVYFGAVIVLSLVEGVIPRRDPGDRLKVRWFGNFALAIIGSIIAKLLFPIAGVALATLCGARGWGLFHAVAAPLWLQVTLTILVLDLAGYTQHYIQHRIPILWRLHRTHHSDHDYDFSTGARFHPLETLFTTACLLVPVAVLGPPAGAVLVSQLISTAIGFIEHGNFRYGATLDRLLQLFVVTPNMHRIHHSRLGAESRTNYGGTFPWWDRLFGTYLAEPAAGHEHMTFGVDGFLERKHLALHWMLAQPFISEPSSHPLDEPINEQEFLQQ
jgi:sterol desaturase/sphingolipid hydroxylase (fatty acid hydroxylase superfamily)